MPLTPKLRLLSYLLFTNGVLVFFLLPYLYGIFSDEHQLDATQLSFLMSADMVGGTVAALAARFWLSKWHWHWVFVPVTIVSITANLLTTSATTATELIAYRTLAGLASGSLMAFAYACLSNTANPDKEFSLALATQTAVGAALLLLTPTLLQHWNGDSLFIVLAILSAVPLLLTKELPKQNPAADDIEMTAELSYPIITGLGSILVYMLTLTAVWVVAEQIAGDLGFSTKLISFALSSSLFFSFFGAIAPAILGDNFSRFRLIAFSYATLAIALVLVEQSTKPILFVIGLCLYNFFYNFTIPMQIAWFSALDTTGRTVVLVSVAQGLGVSLGPMLGVAVLSKYGATSVFLCCLALLFISFLMMYAANRTTNKPI